MKSLEDRISSHYKPDFVNLIDEMSVRDAINHLRENEIKDKIFYFYVTDRSGKLKGVVQARQLLTSAPDEKLSNLIKTGIISITTETSITEACDLFTRYKYLALPVTDPMGQLVGTVDISLFTEEIEDLTERRHADEAFELIGFRIGELAGAGVLKAWKIRFPWLLATISSGIIAAFITKGFARTLEENIVMAFFITLVLALCESVAVQSLSVSIRRLHYNSKSSGNNSNYIISELITAALMAISTAALVGLIIGLWFGFGINTAIIALTITLSITFSSVTGYSVPYFLHKFNWDPKVAAGPISLALADIITLLIYFNLGSWLK